MDRLVDESRHAAPLTERRPVDGQRARRDAFLRALRAETVAVIGASADPAKLGHETLRTLLSGGFGGRIYPVNPRGGEILGLPSYRSLEDLPCRLDLALVVIPAAHVVEVVEQAGRKGAAAAVVLSGGFREAGEADLERDLVAAGRRHGTLVIGPNVQGIAYVPNRLSALMYPDLHLPGPLAVVGQSGSITAAIAEWAERDGLGVSALVNLGNEADVDESDVIEWLVDDADTRVVALYLEGVREGRRFAETACAVAERKPVVVLKAGRTPAGRRAVASHTASLAGSDEVFAAACRQYGIQQTAHMVGLYDTAKALVLVRPPKGRRLLAISSSGGTGALAIDEASRLGLEPVVLPHDYLQALRGLGLSPRTSYANPLDIDSVEVAEFAACAELAAEHEVADVILFGFGDPVPGAPGMVADFLAGGERSALAVYLGGGPTELADVPQFHRADIACFPSPERALRSLAAVIDRDERLRRRREAVGSRTASAVCHDTGQRSDRRLRGESRLARPVEASTWLLEPQAAALLGEYDVCYPRHELADDLAQARAAATRIGYPLVLKVVSRHVVHKSDVGAVAVGITDDEALAHAYESVMGNVQRRMPEAVVEGVLLVAQAPPGLELIVGARRDPLFGPTVALGLGGTLVELIDEVALRLAPLGEIDAQEMIDETRVGAMLTGVRGAAPLDREALVGLLLAVSGLFAAEERLLELDLNPVRVYEQGCQVLDVRARLAAAQLDDGAGAAAARVGADAEEGAQP
jgi:acetyltransferase